MQLQTKKDEEFATELALGTAQLGTAYGIANSNCDFSVAHQQALLNEALVEGIQTFDTAAAYGNSEKMIGHFLKLDKTSREELCICTKSTGFTREGNLEDSISAEIDLSLSRLNTSYVDYYLLHNVEDLRNYGIDLVTALEKQSSKLKIIGASIYQEEDIELCMQYPLFRAIQVPISALDTRLINSGILKRARKRGIRIFARSIYLQGLLLTGRLPKGFEPLQRIHRLLDFLAGDNGLTRKELLFTFVRDIGLVDYIVVGCESVCQIRENAHMMKLPQMEERVTNSVLEQLQLDSSDEWILDPRLWSLRSG